MFALIDPTTTVKHLTNWVPTLDPDPKKSNYFDPVYEELVNSARICQIADVTFDVAAPFFWLECSSDVIPELTYYDKSNLTIAIIENVAHPLPNGNSPIATSPQPKVSGAQTF